MVEHLRELFYELSMPSELAVQLLNNLETFADHTFALPSNKHIKVSFHVGRFILLCSQMTSELFCETNSDQEDLCKLDEVLVVLGQKVAELLEDNFKRLHEGDESGKWNLSQSLLDLSFFFMPHVFA